MRSILKVVALAGLFAAFACAETWNARLLDASCVQAQKSPTCDPTASTVSFAMNVSGKIYRLDDAGNAKAVEALKGKTERAKDPNQPKEAGSPEGTAIAAKVTGSLEGDVVKVESIQVQ
jgi:hypothetical protein